MRPLSSRTMLLDNDYRCVRLTCPGDEAMSVLLETSLGDLVVDLNTSQCPRSCENFLKLCKAYKYHYQSFFSVQKNFLAQTGDPTNTGEGGQSIWSLLPVGSPAHSSLPYFRPERSPSLRHAQRGTISMACRLLQPDDEDSLVAGSQFFITLADDIEYLDDKHAPFGRIVEGDEPKGTLEKMNAAFVDHKTNRPMRDIRIQHVVVLDDPYDDPVGLSIPSRTPSPTPQQLAAIGLDADVPLEDDEERPAEEVEEERRKRDRDAAALTLEMVGDLPFAEVRPPENILFVCKLNPVTRSEDLELIFSRFGRILSCEVIRDKRTNDSLQYAFIEFDEQKAAEQAYFKMQNVLVDDRRIWVDFSQSVTKLSNSWNTSRARGKPLKVTHGAAHPSQQYRRDEARSHRDDARRGDYAEHRRENRRDRTADDSRHDDRHDGGDRSYHRTDFERRRDERSGYKQNEQRDRQRPNDRGAQRSDARIVRSRPDDDRHSNRHHYRHNEEGLDRRRRDNEDDGYNRIRRYDGRQRSPSPRQR